MSTPNDGGDQPGIPPELEALLRQLLGPAADDVLAELAEAGPGGTPDLQALASAAGLPQDPAVLSQMIAQVQGVLAAGGDGPVNWELAHDLARQTAVTEGDPSVAEAQRRDVAGALQVAELWLDQATDLPPSGGPVRAWSRSEWVEHTLPRWRTLSEPVAESVGRALADVLRDQLPELPEGLAGLGGPGGLSAFGGAGAPEGGLAAVLERLGAAVFGMQLGNAVGTLSREVFGTTDIGLPLLDGPGTALLPRNVAAFAEGLDVPAEEVRLFLALREAAHDRLFTHVGWLRGHLLGAVAEYARGIAIDTEALEEAVRSIDPTDPAAIQEALSGGVFALGTTPAQQSALRRLETALALVEGWVDEVTASAAAGHLPHTQALREMLRRRRAAGGPAEDIFATLVGLELRPRRSREAARLWAEVAAEGGTAAREAVWDHPDLLPTADDLDDPAGFTARRTTAASDAADVDRALAEIFGEEDARSADDARRDDEPDTGPAQPQS